MTAKRIVGFLATSAGWLVLGLAVTELVLLFYFRPTIEYSYVGRRSEPLPDWVTGELVGIVFGVLLVVVGSILLWSGRRWRRQSA